MTTGNQSEIRALCTPDAGWGVSLRVSGQEKPQAELQKELRDQFLAAARRHLEALAQASPPATLEEALDRLRGDDAEEAVRIREAAAVARDGKQTQLRTLCARGAGWNVQLRASNKERPVPVLRAELQSQILVAARRYLSSVQAASSSSSAALAQASPPATLEEALDRLRGDDTEEAVRIRGAAAVVEEGNKSQIEALCTRGGGWNVKLRASSQKKATAVLKTELQSQILVAARRHLSSVIRRFAERGF